MMNRGYNKKINKICKTWNTSLNRCGKAPMTIFGARYLSHGGGIGPCNQKSTLPPLDWENGFFLVFPGFVKGFRENSDFSLIPEISWPLPAILFVRISFFFRGAGNEGSGFYLV
jgi:hypothetical protein